jgi:hypothetical protein
MHLSEKAQQLRSKGRGGDTILAHINPTEAAMLKAMGGSGTINPKTGLPEFGFFDNPIQATTNFLAAPSTAFAGASAPAAPAAPDYAGAATAQGQANIDAARLTAKLGNPNIVNPYGTQTVTYANDQPTVTQTLNPMAQKALTSQQSLQANMADLANTGYKNAFGVLSNPFSFGGPAVQTSLAAPGTLQGGPTAGQYGTAGGVDASKFGTASGVDLSQYGKAQGGVNAPNLQTSLDLSGVAKMPVNAGMTAQEAIMSRLEPTLARNRVSTETQLINQGLRPGTEAYDNAARILGQQENDQRTQAALQGLNLDLSANQQGFGQALNAGQFGNTAQLAGFGAGLQNQQAANQAIAQNFGQGTAAQQLANQAIGQNFGQGTTAQQMQNAAIGQNFGQGQTAAQANNAMVAQQANQNLQQGQFANTAQQQALAQALQQRQMPINEIAALTSQSQIQNPQFGAYQGSNIAPAPIANAAAQTAAFNQNLYNQQTASANQNLTGLFGLGGAALSNIPAITSLFSDIRLKSNIKRIGTHKTGLGIYAYDIFGHREIGVMAQEAMILMPDAVSQHSSGYLMVNYGRLNG